MSLRQRAIGLYVLIAYGFTWTVWLPYLVAVRRGAEPPSPFLYYLAGLGPLLGAVTAEAFERGRYGVQDLLSRLLDWRRAGPWLVVGLLSPLALVPLGALAVAAGGHGWPVWSDFGITSRAPGLGPLATWLLMTASYGVGEEAGWRGFLLPRLQRNRPALAATGRLTLIWAGWHTPAFFFREGYVGLGVPGVIGFLLGLGAGAIVLTALYNASNGSILVVALWHGSWNWVATSDGLQGPWVAVMTALVMVTAPVVVWCWGSQRLAPRPRVVVPEQTQPEPAFPATNR